MTLIRKTRHRKPPTTPLERYMYENYLTVAGLAEKCKVSSPCMSRIMKGANTFLKLAVRIEVATKGKVKCIDLLDEEEFKAIKEQFKN